MMALRLRMAALARHTSVTMTMPILLRRLARSLVLLAVLGLPVAPALAQEASDAYRTRLNTAKMQLDSVESRLAVETIDDDTLQGLRAQLDPVRGELVAIQSDVTGPRDASRARLDKIGPPPKPEDPPESADVAGARKREQGLFGDLDGVAREAQVQVVRTDQLANAITERRRDAFARQLTKRELSVVDPYFWVSVAGDLPRLAWTLSTVGGGVAAYFLSGFGLGPAALALSVLIAGLLAARFLRARILALRVRIEAREAASRRFVGALSTMLGIVRAILGWPMAALVPLLALRLADLAPDRILGQFGFGIVGGLLIGVVFNATAEGILAIESPSTRLLPLSDWAVRRIGRRTHWIAAVIGVYVVLAAIGKAIYAPVNMTVAITACTALLLAVIGATLLVRLRSAPPAMVDGQPLAPEDDVNRLDILRPILWVAVAGVVLCLLAGYVAMAGFIALFPISALFTASFAYALMTLVDAGLTETLAGDAQRGRIVANAIGVSPKNVAFAATLLSGVLRFLVLAAAVAFLGGPLGFYSADMVSAIQRAFFGFQVGEITISPSSILLAVFLFTVVIGVMRLVRGWVRNTLLPRTTMDAGLQNSIATVVGYIGIVLAIAVGLSEVGLDLQNVAIVAGALSVGIGFGLQSIVSNFVSGLILLAERPIRVGDIIAVSGEEGFVRRISVRATEIETYDRATLIIPNSQLITGVVKNWVYGNTWSRVKVSLSVGYDVDLDAVKAAMLAAAEDDPRILPTPPARVFLARLGDAALEFELVAVVASVETMPAVRSDLHLRIVRSFRARGIRMVAQLPAAPAPVVVSLEEALGATEAARLRGSAANAGT